MGLAWMRTAGFCPPLMLTRPTPGNCEILGARRVSARSSTLESGIGLGRQRQGQDRACRRDWSWRKSAEWEGPEGRKVPAALIDCCTSCSATSMFRLEIELQGDDGAAVGAGRGHLLQAGHLAELPLERRGDRGGHHVGAGAGIEGDDLDGRVIHLGQSGDGQAACRPRRRPAGCQPSAGTSRPAGE